MKKTIFLLIALMSVSYQVLSQNNYRDQIYSAFVKGDIGKWVIVLKLMENEKFNSTDKKLELTGYYYGYVGYLLGKKNFAEAEKYIAKGEKLITEVLKTNSRNATALSFKGSFTGFRISMSKFKSISLGPESIANVNMALQIDPQNIQALVDKANILYHAPRLFGGDKQAAILFFQKAIRVMETTKNDSGNWLYMNTMIQLAKAYENNGQYKAAAKVYERILIIEPDFKRVSSELYPSLKSKLN